MNLRTISFRPYALCLFFLALLSAVGCSFEAERVGANVNSAQQEYSWVGTWSTAPQLTEPRNNPPQPGLADNTLRQIFRISIGGSTMRMRFSNEFSESPLTIKRAALAKSFGGGAVDTASAVKLSFSGEAGVTIEPGDAVYSDEFSLPVDALTELAVTIAFGGVPEGITGHPGSRTTSYIVPGNDVLAPSMHGAITTDHWYIISGLEVKAPQGAGSIVIMGDSITDGRGSGTNKQNRWPDELANRLQDNSATRHIAVLNQGIGGNCITRPCLGPAGVDRFSRDVLSQRGVQWLIIFEGINDIGGRGSLEATENIISVYRDMINQARLAGIKVYGATLTPIKGSGYETPASLKAVNRINQWIRNSGEFDAVIDFYQAVSDPDNPGYLLPEYDSGDGLHLSEVGYRAMAQSINLALFSD